MNETVDYWDLVEIAYNKHGIVIGYLIPPELKEELENKNGGNHNE